MSFGQAIASCFSNYATAKGRAPRSEYWYWMLFAFLVGAISALIDMGLGVSAEETGPVNAIATLALLLPGIAVTVRRLHDVGKSGWWYLIVFTCVGVIPLLIWMCRKGDETTNEYGNDPLAFPMSGVPPIQ